MRHGFASVLLVGWVIAIPPRSVDRDCRNSYDEAAPLAQWERTTFSYDAKETCDRARAELAKRQESGRGDRVERAKQREGEAGIMGRFVMRWFSSPSTWDRCEALADYWLHARCIEAATQ